MGLGISKKEFRMMAVLLSGAFLAVLNATLMTPALPTIMGDMGVDSTTVQWLTSGYALTEAVVIIIALFQAALIGMETIMPLYIQGVLPFSGIAMLPGAVIGAFTGLFAGRLFDKHGVRRPVLAGAAGITVSLIGFASLQIDTPIVAVTLVYAVMAIGMQFTMTPVNTWGVNSLPNDAIQHAQSTSNTMNQVAASFGTALLVSVAATVSANTTSLTGLENTFLGYHAAFCTTALLAGVAVVLIVALVRDGKRAKAGAGAVASRVVSVDVNTPLDVACDVLAKRKIKKVPVTRDGVLVGALSRRNILHAIITGEQPGN
ncbi:MFS transporter [Senegalimassilia sp.]